MTYSIIILLFHIAGALSAAHAIRKSVTPQGAVAWVFALFLFPYIALFLYWTFSYPKEHRYKQLIDAVEQTYREERKQLIASLDPFKSEAPKKLKIPQILLGELCSLMALRGNELTLCIDGKQTFEELFAEIKAAKQRIFVNFYIIRSDRLGEQFKRLLIQRAKDGLKVCVLYDGLGSIWLSNRYLRELKAGGVQVASFRTSLNPFSAFSLNYRNHRKVVVIDSKVTFVGGHNIGDEYMGKSSYFKGWRDTQLKLSGPASRVVEATFVEDWYHSTGRHLGISNEEIIAKSSDKTVLPLSTGPHTPEEGCSLMFFDAIVNAQKRFWITTPYFVPDETISRALEHAALRGVDVRVLVPFKSDHYLAWLASHSYYKKMINSGLRFFQYTEGFLHQKVFLVDDSYSCVGSANLDNRSFRLNFELSLLVFDRDFNGQISDMLESDFQKSQEVTIEEVNSYSLPFEVVAGAARLFSPIL